MLKELYHGSINPSERISASVNPKWEALSEKFESTLSPEQLEMFHELSDMQSDSAADENAVAYELGFKDGARMMMEVLK